MFVFKYKNNYIGSPFDETVTSLVIDHFEKKLSKDRKLSKAAKNKLKSIINVVDYVSALTSVDAAFHAVRKNTSTETSALTAIDVLETILTILRNAVKDVNEGHLAIPYPYVTICCVVMDRLYDTKVNRESFHNLFKDTSESSFPFNTILDIIQTAENGNEAYYTMSSAINEENTSMNSILSDLDINYSPLN